MIHNIVTDKEGNEHQAVSGYRCSDCSLNKVPCTGIDAECVPYERRDETNVIYKRRIKITDITRGE